MRFHSKWMAVVASLVVVFSSTGVRAADKDIVDTAVAAGSFKTLAAALGAADLVGALKGDGPFTVLAPTDAAFAKLPAGTVETLLKPENKDQLTAILTYHVVKGAVPAKVVTTLNGATSLNGQRIDIKTENGKVMVDGATVVQTDINCSNGIIHVIDEVILPASDNIPTVATEAGFSTLVAAVKAAGLADALSGKGPFTVFAPTDEAFAKLPKGTLESLLKPENKSKLAEILKYHVVQGRVYSPDALEAGKAKTLQGDSIKISVRGGDAMVNGAKLVTTDVDASNGVIHVIDSVILPPEKQSSVNPRHMIEVAIGKGAPLYNAGHHGACAKVYMDTVETLVSSHNGNMCPTTMSTLKTALNNAKHSHSADSQAWTLRHALDFAYNRMPVTVR